jgi:GMP synthase (glutamine-hydrolysing)
MPGLTLTSKVLATSAGCPRQIVEYSNLVYGFQCHLEFTFESITALIDISIDEFNDIDRHNYLQSSASILTQSSLLMNSLLFEFMDKLVEEYALSVTSTITSI